MDNQIQEVAKDVIDEKIVLKYAGAEVRVFENALKVNNLDLEDYGRYLHNNKDLHYMEEAATESPVKVCIHQLAVFLDEKFSLIVEKMKKETNVELSLYSPEGNLDTGNSGHFWTVENLFIPNPVLIAGVTENSSAENWTIYN